MTAAGASQGFTGLVAMAALLGVRHGLDADHLAAIDGLTRANSRDHPRLARVAGLLFSIGHGAVVMAIAVAATTVAADWRLPGWLDAFGAWSAIGVLAVLALGNIAGVLMTPPDRATHPAGWRSRLAARWLRGGSAAWVLGIGALFAVSFDTLSQAMLFSLLSSRFGGVVAAATLAAVFIAGMLATDAVNGFWISHLIHRADRTARVASRTVSLTVAGIGLMTAALGAAVQLSPDAARWAEGKELWFAAAVIGVAFTGFLTAMALSGTSFRTERLCPEGRVPSSG